MSALSRRSIVASAAALPALAVPAVALAAAEPDPIYAAIEAHRVAYAAWEKALRRCNDLAPDHAPNARIHVRNYYATETSHEEDGETFIWKVRRTGKLKPIYVSYDEDIEKNAPKKLKGVELDAWIEEKRAELAAEQKRLDEEFAKTPDGKLVTVRNALGEKEAELQDELFGTTPTTTHGLLAVLSYIRSDEYLSECIWTDADDALRLASMLERAVCHFAGLPEPSPWAES
jgi:hypothetical protein